MTVAQNAGPTDHPLCSRTGRFVVFIKTSLILFLFFWVDLGHSVTCTNLLRVYLQHVEVIILVKLLTIVTIGNN